MIITVDPWPGGAFVHVAHLGAGNHFVQVVQVSMWNEDKMNSVLSKLISCLLVTYGLKLTDTHTTITLACEQAPG